MTDNEEINISNDNVIIMACLLISEDLDKGKIEEARLIINYVIDSLRFSDLKEQVSKKLYPQ